MSDTEIEVGLVREELIARFHADPLESTAVALDSLRFVGSKYRMSRELYPGYIDCSTIVSQAHWDAAGVQTPFIAESQRLAYSATRVPDLEQALPGDVLVAHPSLAQSPDRDHNHVALLLTREPGGDGWVIEARPKIGTRIIRLSQASWEGGIRRFCPNPLTAFPTTEPWQGLALATPKIARLGARLIAHYRGGDPNGPARRHSGIDVYAPAGSTVLAPIGGTVRISATGEPRRCSVAIRDVDSDLSTLLAPVLVAPGIRTGDTIAPGDYLGELDTEHRWYGCNALVSRRGQPHLHWELWSVADLGYPAAQGIVAPEREMADAAAEAYNPIYAVKLGKVGSPLKGAPASV